MNVLWTINVLHSVFCMKQTLPTTPKTTPKILNLPYYNFSNIQLSLLHHSTKFTETSSGSLLDFKNDLSNITKKIQMKVISYNTEYEDESVVRNKSIRKFETKSRELSLIINEIENFNTKHNWL